MRRVRRIALDLEAIADLDNQRVAEIWADPESTKKLRYSDWGPMVFGRLEPRPGAMEWLFDQLLENAEILLWSSTLPAETAVTLQAEAWYWRHTNRNTNLHVVKDRLFEAAIYIHADKDLEELGITPNHRQVNVGPSGPFPADWVEQFMDVDVTPPTEGVTEPGTDDPTGLELRP